MNDGGDIWLNMVDGLSIIGTFPGSMSELDTDIVLIDRIRLNSHIFHGKSYKMIINSVIVC